MSNVGIETETKLVEPGMPMAAPDATWMRRALRMLAAFSLIGGLLFAGAIRCPVALLFHVPCPGCGLTRASLALLHGDLGGAFRFHPMVFIALPLLVVFFGLNGVMYVVKGRWGWVDAQMNRSLTVVAFALLLLTIGIWVARFFGALGGPVAV